MGTTRYYTSPNVRTGGSYNHAVVTSCGLVFLAGQLAVDAPDASWSSVGDETQIVMELLTRVLTGLGLGLVDVVRCGIYLTDIDQFAEVDAVYASFFAPGRLPARTCVQVAALIGGCRVEIDAVATTGRGRDAEATA